MLRTSYPKKLSNIHALKKTAKYTFKICTIAFLNGEDNKILIAITLVRVSACRKEGIVRYVAAPGLGLLKAPLNNKRPIICHRLKQNTQHFIFRVILFYIL